MIKCSLFLSGWYCPECGSVTRSVCLGSLTGKEIKIEIRDENQLCAGKKGTTKIALSTMSFINFIIIFPNKLKGGKMYGLTLAHGIVNASTKDA